MASALPYVLMDTMPRLTVDVDDSTLWRDYKVKLARLGKTSQEVLLNFIRKWTKEGKDE
jgi:hypothetical protein